MTVPGLYDGLRSYRSARGRSFDDSETCFSTNKQTTKPRGLPENNLFKSFPADREKTGSVAKIKVVVMFLPHLLDAIPLVFFLNFYTLLLLSM